jgi:uncharacterized membrane protein
MQIQALPGEALAANRPLILRRSRAAMPNGLGGIGLAALLWPLWLVMAVLAAVMLGLMLVLEPLYRIGDVLRPGRPRRRWRTGVTG